MTKKITKIKSKKEDYAINIAMFSKGLTVSRGSVTINVAITEKHLEISGNNGTSFIFRSANDPKTIKRWDEVIGCLQVAVRELKKARKL